GCSSNLPGFINAYGMHTLHGRSLAVATGVKLANHELKVICTGGDGDGYGIGGNHFVHTMRRNVDLTYIVMDNQIYGLTTGQVSPTSVKGMKTKSTPHGSVENPINPIHAAIDRGYQWGDEIPIGLFWKRTDLPTLEDQEPVLHDGQGPLGWRKLGVSNEQAQSLIEELM